ncbi:hypothetical protein GIB67_041953, partial [Kingdonia uniflora]
MDFQGQLLTLVEYMLLLYRALLPAPVWYRFFLNKEYGSLFSSLTTGLYLTFKLTSVVEKVQAFFTSLKALSRKEVHYGSHATSEQVNAAGDLCAICQEKMHAPILLRCKHIFCEDCVSEWSGLTGVRELASPVSSLAHTVSLRGNELVPYVGRWLSLRISNRMVMGQHVCFSRYFEGSYWYNPRGRFCLKSGEFYW